MVVNGPKIGHVRRVGARVSEPCGETVVDVLPVFCRIAVLGCHCVGPHHQHGPPIRLPRSQACSRLAGAPGSSIGRMPNHDRRRVPVAVVVHDRRRALRVAVRASLSRMSGSPGRSSPRPCGRPRRVSSYRARSHFERRAPGLVMTGAFASAARCNRERRN
jgi:hypothetical protein